MLTASSTSSPRSSHSRRAMWKIRTRCRWTTRLLLKWTASALRKVRSAWGSPECCRRKTPLPEPRPRLEGALTWGVELERENVVGMIMGECGEG